MIYTEDFDIISASELYVFPDVVIMPGIESSAWPSYFFEGLCRIQAKQRQSTMAENVEEHLSIPRLSWESEHEWKARKSFLDSNKDIYNGDRLASLSMAWSNWKFMGCNYGDEVQGVFFNYKKLFCKKKYGCLSSLHLIWNHHNFYAYSMFYSSLDHKYLCFERSLSQPDGFEILCVLHIFAFKSFFCVCCRFCIYIKTISYCQKHGCSSLTFDKADDYFFRVSLTIEYV